MKQKDDVKEQEHTLLPTTELTVQIQIGPKVIEKTFLVPFTKDNVDQLQQAHQIIESDAFRSRVMSGSSPSREVATSIPWAGGLMNRDQAIHDIEKATKQIDGYLQREAEKPGTYNAAEITDLQALKGHLSEVLSDE